MFSVSFFGCPYQALASSEVVLSYLRGYERDKVVSSFTGMEESCPTLPLTEALIDLLSGNKESDSRISSLKP